MEKHYKCPWCENEFERNVIYEGKSKKASYSTKVICTKCTNAIPTWEKQMTGEVVGRKHMHIRK